MKLFAMDRCTNLNMVCMLPVKVAIEFWVCIVGRGWINDVGDQDIGYIYIIYIKLLLTV